MAPPNISALFPEPDLGIFAPAIKEAQAASAAQNPLLELGPAIAGVTQDPLDTTAQQYKQKAILGLLSGLISGVGDQWQGSRNDAIRNAALGNGDTSSLAPNVLAPIANAKSIWGANQALQYARGSQILPLEMEMQKMQQDAEYKKAIDVAKLEHPEAAMLAGALGKGGAPGTSTAPTKPTSAAAIDDSTASLADLYSKYGDLDAAKNAKKDAIDKKTADQKEFEKFLSDGYNTVGETQNKIASIAADQQQAGYTGPLRAPDLQLQVESMVNPKAADRLKGGSGLNVDAIKLMENLRGKLPLRNQMEFNALLNASPSSSKTSAQNQGIMQNLQRGVDFGKSYLDFLSHAKVAGMSRAAAEQAYQAVDSSYPAVIKSDNGISPNDGRFKANGNSLWGRFLLSNMGSDKVQALAAHYKALNPSSADGNDFAEWVATQLGAYGS